MERISGRMPGEERETVFTPGFIKRSGGSVLVECGNTRVICCADADNHVPQWMRGSGKGWLTAEYGMLPQCSDARINREKHLSSGRTKEIQRLIGRALRGVIDLSKLGERTFTVDCDVIEADGGTRTASVNGACLALALLFVGMHDRGELEESPMADFIGAVSVGIVDEMPISDLEYSEDSRAEVDMNVVMTSSGRFIEIQGTAERMPFSKDELDSLLGYASDSIKRIIEQQKAIFSKEQLDWLVGRSLN